MVAFFRAKVEPQNISEATDWKNVCGFFDANHLVNLGVIGC